MTPTMRQLYKRKMLATVQGSRTAMQGSTCLALESGNSRGKHVIIKKVPTYHHPYPVYSKAELPKLIGGRFSKSWTVVWRGT